MTGPELITIAGAATVLAVTPGPETILTVRLSALPARQGSSTPSVRPRA